MRATGLRRYTGIMVQHMLSILNANKTNAGIVAGCLIILIEFLLNPYLSNKYFSHEVDEMLHYLEQPKKDQSVVAIGDSVGNGIFGEWNFNNGNVASLACNQATETAGQYFFLRRFLKNNKAPGAVISCDRTPLSGNLEQSLTENYIQRCFTDWSEILELMIVKTDPVFTIKMVAYKFFSTFKYRLHLQRKIVGFTNSDIYSGATQPTKSAKKSYSLIEVVSKFKEHHRTESISQYFFKKILVELEKIHVPLYYLPSPSRLDTNDNHLLVQSSIKHLNNLKKEFANLHILEDHYQRLPGKYFRDEVHLNQAGLENYRPLIQPTIERILLESTRRQADNWKSD